LRRRGETKGCTQNVGGGEDSIGESGGFLAEFGTFLGSRTKFMDDP